MARPLHARLISTRVTPHLLPRGQLGSAHSVFRGAVNIACGGELLTLCTAATGALPNGVVLAEDVDLFGLGIAVGALVWHDSLLRVGPVSVDLSAAESWSPTLQPASIRPLEQVRIPLARAMRHGTMSTGFAPLLSVLAQTPSMPRRTVLVGRASRAIDEVVCAIGEHNLVDAVAAARNLIGLGDGLTPSGDDFLIGVGAALRAASHPLHDSFMSACRDLAGGRTTTVAETFYRHAAAGAYSARVHRLVASLADPTVDLGGELELALDWGASSGADCLLGVLLAAEAARQPKHTEVGAR